MISNFDKCLAEVLKHEGGWADHPKDPGGATMKGVTIAVFREYKGRDVTKAELRAISVDDLRAIYKRGYWDKVRADDLPMGLDLVAFDAAVNSGPSRGAKWLQSAIGVTVDGKIGPETLAYARAANIELTIDRACDERLMFLQRLKTWGTFGRGWSARVASVRKAAKAMSTGAAPLAPNPLDDDRVSKTAKTEHDAPDVLTKPSFWAGIIAAIIAAFKKGR
jgi:lysozyme family protein